MATKLAYTPLDEINQIHARLHASFRAGTTKPIAARKENLAKFAYMVKDNIGALQDALTADLGRPKVESLFLEINSLVKESVDTYKSVEKWARPDKAPFSLNFAPMKPVVRKEPKGVVLVISPFNYPVWLALSPAIGAIAAGCAVVVKPSELTPATSALLAELIAKYLPPDVITVVNGGIPETTRLLDLPWAHIFYTGGGNVGKIVATAAAKHLTPVTLELGGKSPVIIDPTSDMKVAARRILWGKATNAGQTCVAPDYVLVPRDGQDALVNELQAAYKEFYPQGAKVSDSYSRIISTGHWDRVKGMLDGTSGKVVVGGGADADRESKFIAPTVVKDVDTDDTLMKSEIFGPILPIVPVRDVDAAIEYVNANDHPLALYVFTKDPKFKAKVFDNTLSGAAVANDLIVHIAVDGLPFGGVGPSGYGAHTAKFTFDTFTHLRASLDSPGWLDMILGVRFPPYTASKAKKLAGLTPTAVPFPRPGDKAPSPWAKWATVMAFLGILSAALAKFRK
ncbi:aldehyde dehydrogenase (NAD) family protein [Rhizoctonia solani 123E]|uniref:Aldehyde dehydrogenase n=1 Tax=Rhizoctonia solani 123E TaxID=1423351 RepID=A0A074SPX9_9AGAM|nr:aldehyde dehydrogenase (NAD) family protein [Rhizoctonia solani 123E]